MPNTGHNNNVSEVRVAVGVIRDSAGRVLIAKRPPSKHQGDLWEFPGGKIEAGESCEVALARELFEELGIKVLRSSPLICVPFTYPDKKVFLEVREVGEFVGKPAGKEGQPLRWAALSELNEYAFPAANAPIIKAVHLPKFICVTGEFTDHADLVFRIERAVSRGVGMIVFRPDQRVADPEAEAVYAAAECCRRKGVLFVAHSSLGRDIWAGADGVHFRAEQLDSLEDRPVGPGKWFGASCHNHEEITRARSLGADYLFVSPVLATVSHPEAETLGWKGLAALISEARVPAYALGGLGVDHLSSAKQAGALGIAAISAFWK